MTGTFNKNGPYHNVDVSSTMETGGESTAVLERWAQHHTRQHTVHLDEQKICSVERLDGLETGVVGPPRWSQGACRASHATTVACEDGQAEWNYGMELSAA